MKTTEFYDIIDKEIESSDNLRASIAEFERERTTMVEIIDIERIKLKRLYPTINCV